MRMLAILAGIVGGINLAFAADDKPADLLLKEARALYGEREDLNKVDQVISILMEAASKSPEKSHQKFEIYVFASRAAYWKGQNQTAKDAKMKVMESCMNFALEARQQNPDLAESYYLYGIGLARWAEAKGALEALKKKKLIMESMDETLARDTFEGTSGESYDGFGPDRVFGRMYFRLPASAGGSRELALKHLRLAFFGDKKFPLNHIYLAEVLLAGNSTEKHEGCEILKNLSKQDPMTLNPDRVPENKLEMGEGKKLQATSCP